VSEFEVQLLHARLYSAVIHRMFRSRGETAACWEG